MLQDVQHTLQAIDVDQDTCAQPGQGPAVDRQDRRLGVNGWTGQVGGGGRREVTHPKDSESQEGRWERQEWDDGVLPYKGQRPHGTHLLAKVTSNTLDTGRQRRRSGGDSLSRACLEGGPKHD